MPNSKLHAVIDGKGRLLLLLLSEGQMSDFKGAALLVDALPRSKELLADRVYDADWLRNALINTGISHCIPSRKNRKIPIDITRLSISNDTRLENMFAKLKD